MTTTEQTNETTRPTCVGVSTRPEPIKDPNRDENRTVSAHRWNRHYGPTPSMDDVSACKGGAERGPEFADPDDPSQEGPVRSDSRHVSVLGSPALDVKGGYIPSLR